MTISKPTTTEGLVGFIASICLTTDYSIFAQIPLYVFIPVIMFFWNFPILVYIKDKKIKFIVGWECQNNKNIKK